MVSSGHWSFFVVVVLCCLGNGLHRIGQRNRAAELRRYLRMPWLYPVERTVAEEAVSASARELLKLRKILFGDVVFVMKGNNLDDSVIFMQMARQVELVHHHVLVLGRDIVVVRLEHIAGAAPRKFFAVDHASRLWS